MDPAATLVVMEATGNYWIALAIVLHQAGFAVSVVNPAAPRISSQKPSRNEQRMMPWMPRF